MVDHPDAPAGKEMKYARREHERRFLLARRLADPPVMSVVITDRYITATRLRLRRMEQVEPARQPPVLKLAQKVPDPAGGPGLITNIYLNAAEYDVFAALPATVLTKTRHSIPPFGVDVFGGELAGLFLAEIEFDTAEEYQAFQAPEFAVREVTRDPRFSGGHLVAMAAAELRELLRSSGVDVA